MPSNNGYQQLSSGRVPSYQSSSSGANVIPKPMFVDEVADGTPLPSLRLGDQVVWLSDTGPEYGVVKWLGKLPDVGSEWMAGVDFVNPVGSGTGLYNDFKLFETRMNHASLVPIVGLMKATDFEGPTSCTMNELTPPQKPRRTKKIETCKFYTDGSSTPSSTLSKRSPPEDRLSNESALDRISAELAKHRISRDLPKFANSSSSITDSYSSENLPLENSIFKTMSSSDSKSTVFSDTSGHQNGYGLPLTVSIPKISETKSDELFEIGSIVEVFINSSSYSGVIRWLGFTKNDKDYKIDSIRKSDKNFKNVMAGIELEEEISGLTDGTLNGRRYFDCSPNKAFFVALCDCSKDCRFSSGRSLSDNEAISAESKPANLFGSIDCPTVLGDIPPLTSEDITRLCGKNRGIQGHHNSCYLDATLFAMFSYTSIFESLLNRPKRPNDIPEYNEVQRILKEEIVNPLRANLYVRADRVMHLRQLLERISSVRGLTSEEKDPEEFINLLLNEILKTDPFLKLSSGLESFFYQLFVEKDETLQIPNVQQLFDQSFLASDFKLREVPSCLLIQMPRFGREFKMYPRVMPSLYLDITNVLENSPRQCTVCGELAEFECKECFGKLENGLDSIAFCAACLEKSHTHKKRLKHKSTKLKIPGEFMMLKSHATIPRVVMELFAVLCIETSHYVSFVKCGPGPESPWCFFDSMADRKGEQDGYNIPEVVAFPDLNWWLSDEGYNYLLNNKDDKMIPELPRRLFSDAYICFYSSEVSRYR